MAKLTTITKAQASQFLKNYTIAKDSPSFQWQALSGGTVNTLYKIHYPKQNYYLKIDEVGDLKRLSQEMSLLQHLSQAQLPYFLPCALPKSNGALLTPYQNKFIYLLHEVPGQSLACKNLQAIHFKQLGQALGKLHKVKPHKTAQPHNWHLLKLGKTLSVLKPQLLQTNPSLYLQLKSILQDLKKHQSPASQNRLIHADAFYDNLHWQKNKLVGILDFEYAGLGSPLYDIAMTLLANAWTGTELNIKFAKAFLTSYQKVRPLKKISVQDWRHAFSHAAITIVITRLKTFEFGPMQNNPKAHRDYRDFLKRYDWAQAVEWTAFTAK